MVPLAYIFLPKAPGKCRFLNQEENEIVALRATQGRGHEEEGKLDFKQVCIAFYDYKNYIQAVIAFCLNVSFPQFFVRQNNAQFLNNLGITDCLCRVACVSANNHRRYRLFLCPIARAVRASLPCLLLYLPYRQFSLR